MYRKFYSYNDMPVIKPTPPVSSAKPDKEICKKQEKSFLAGFENDDLILLAVFFILIMDNCEDRLLLLALAFIFFADSFSDNNK